MKNEENNGPNQMKQSSNHSSLKEETILKPQFPQDAKCTSKDLAKTNTDDTDIGFSDHTTELRSQPSLRTATPQRSSSRTPPSNCCCSPKKLVPHATFELLLLSEEARPARHLRTAAALRRSSSRTPPSNCCARHLRTARTAPPPHSSEELRPPTYNGLLNKTLHHLRTTLSTPRHLQHPKNPPRPP